MSDKTLKDSLYSAYIERSLQKGMDIAPNPLSSNQRQLNAWYEFCKLNKIFPRYQDISIDSLVIQPNEDGEPFSAKAMRWINRPRSLVLRGRAGRGKTHFMFALVREMFLSKGLRVGDIRYFDHVELDRRLQEEMVKYKSSRGIMEQLCDTPILVLDDFGIDAGTVRHERDFYEMLNNRFGNNLITIISTNLDEPSLYKAYGERISSRLKEAAVIEFNGHDLRGTL
jgi:DNA replication protein DnaC